MVLILGVQMWSAAVRFGSSGLRETRSFIGPDVSTVSRLSDSCYMKRSVKGRRRVLGAQSSEIAVALRQMTTQWRLEILVDNRRIVRNIVAYQSL